MNFIFEKYKTSHKICKNIKQKNSHKLYTQAQQGSWTGDSFRILGIDPAGEPQAAEAEGAN